MVVERPGGGRGRTYCRHGRTDVGTFDKRGITQSLEKNLYLTPQKKDVFRGSQRREGNLTLGLRKTTGGLRRHWS